MKRLLYIFTALLLTGFTSGCQKNEPATPSETAASGTSGESTPADKPQAGASGDAIDAIGIEPESPKAGQSLAARVSDGQNRVLQFLWEVDGQEVLRGLDDKLPGEYVKKGSEITVSAAPVRDEGLGDWKKSAPVVVENTAPRISGIEFVNSDDQVVTLQTRAEDVDSDPLEYRIIYGPDGMRINADGLIQWSVPADFSEGVTFTVGVSDGIKEFQLESQIGKR